MMKTHLRSLLQIPSAVTGAVLLLIMILMAVFAPLLGGDPTALSPIDRLQAPSGQHPLGTDDLGRDLWTVIVFGARTSLGIAILCSALALTIGFIIGVSSGYFHWVDAVLMRIMDGIMSFPSIILVLSLVGVMGGGFGPLIFGLTLVQIPPVARVVRAAALGVKTTSMVESARAMGSSNLWIMRKYVAPETVSVLIIQATMAFSSIVLSIAALSFLGIGLDPSVPNWGTTLSVAQKYLSTAWWLGVFPGIAIVLTVVGLILLGDGLRDAMDPRARRLAALAKQRRNIERVATAASARQEEKRHA